MYKLVIIEDEIVEREGLVRLKDWESLGIEVVYAAGDGLEGFDKCCEIKPDIIIADIKYAWYERFGDSERSKAVLPCVKSIIVSGYNEFEFAREAVRLNASSYILKPFEDRELSFYKYC